MVLEAKSLSNYKGNLGKVHIRPTNIRRTFFPGKILHRVFFYSIRILPMLETSENGRLSININTECRAKQVRYPPPSARSISNRLHITTIFSILHQERKCQGKPIWEFWSQIAVFLGFLMVSWVFPQLFFDWNRHFWRDLGSSFSEWYRTSLYHLWAWNDSLIISRKYHDFVK